jgi:DNA-binding IclR family transcriptional regulator
MLLRLHDHPDDDLEDLARHLRIPALSLAPLLEVLVERDLVAMNGDVEHAKAEVPSFRLTELGQLDIERLVVARRDSLSELVAEWSPEQHVELAQLLTRLASQLGHAPAPTG